MFQSMLYPLDRSGQVIQCHGRHPDEEHPAEHRLEQLEVFPVKAAGVRQVAEHILSTFAKNDIGKVVVLIDNQIKRIAQLLCFAIDGAQLVGGIGGGFYLTEKVFIVIRAVSLDEAVQLFGAIVVERVLQAFHTRPRLGEVEINHLEAILQRRRMLLNPKPVKQPVELVRLRDVIVSLHHADKHALPETPRTDEEQILARIFQQGKIHRLVYVIEILVPHFLKARHSVWDAFYCVHLCCVDGV